MQSLHRTVTTCMAIVLTAALFMSAATPVPTVI